MIAHPTGVQPERIGLTDRLRGARRNRDHPPAPRGRVKAPVAKEPPALLCGRLWPKERLKRIILRHADPGMSRDIKIATETRRHARQGRVFGKDLRRVLPAKGW